MEPKAPAKRKALKEHKKEPFLKAYARLGTDSAAARAVGISRYAAIEWKKNDPAFYAAYVDARDQLKDKLIETGLSKAEQGDGDMIKLFLGYLDPENFTQKQRHEVVFKQMDRMFALLIGTIKRVVPQDLWPRVAIELQAVASASMDNASQAILQ